MVSSLRNRSTMFQELRYPKTGTAVQSEQDSSGDYMEETRIKFYSNNDITTGHMLGLAEDYLDSVCSDYEIKDINNALEVLNINRLFDSGLKLDKWDAIRYQELTDKNKHIKSNLGRFCSTIDDDSFIHMYDEADIVFKDDFFDLIETYNVISCISEKAFELFLNTGKAELGHLLTHKKIVNKYDSVIANHMVDNSKGAELLIAYYYSDSDQAQEYFFPRSLTVDEKKAIIVDYINSEDVNTNYLSLIIQPLDDSGLSLGERIRYHALKRREQRYKELFTNNSNNCSLRFGAEISFGDCDEEIFDTSDPLVPKIVHSRKWVEDNQDYPTLLNNLIYIFGQVDYQHRCTFVSKKNELSVFERHLGIKGKKDYLVGVAFQQKQIIQLLNLIAYDTLLQELGIDFEDIIRWFFSDYLSKEFGAHGFSYAPASKEDTMIQKCRNMLIEMDSLVKQFNIYVEDGELNREFLEFSSTPVSYSMVRSFIDKKYAYLQDAKLIQAMDLLFSDQTMLGFTERTGGKYRTIVDLLLHENVCMDDYMDYQQHGVKYLMDKGLVRVDSKGYLLLDREKVSVLKDFYQNEVINVAVIKNNNYLNALIAEEEVGVKGTLFSVPEQYYLDYILNRHKFTNGLDLRNRYIHGTNSTDDKPEDYYRILLIMCLLIIKINDEFCYREAIIS